MFRKLRELLLMEIWHDTRQARAAIYLLITLAFVAVMLLRG